MRILLALLFAPALASAASLVTDPLQPKGVQFPTHCKLYLDGGGGVQHPIGFDVNGEEICFFDISAVSVGSHSAYATAVIASPLEESGPSNTLVFVRPGPPSGVPANGRITAT